MNELKIQRKYFEDIFFRGKRFEVRKNDRNFKVGDIYTLREFEKGEYTGRELTIKITYVMELYEQVIAKDYCVFSFYIKHIAHSALKF